MASSLPYRHQSSTADRPIFVTFLSSRSAEAREVISIDSQSDEFLRALNRPCRTVTVLFENQNGTLIIREKVHDGTRPGHGAIGSLIVSLSNFDKPSCQSLKGNILTVTMPLRACSSLRKEHYNTVMEGDWNPGSANRLLSFCTKREAPKVRAISITFFNAAQNAWLKPDYILAVFEQHRNGQGISSKSPSGKPATTSCEGFIAGSGNTEQDKQRRLEAAVEATKVAQKKAQAAQSIANDIQKRFEATQGKLKEAQAENSSLFQHLSAAQEKYRQAQDKLQTSKDTINLLRHEITDVGDKYATCQDQVKVLQKRVNILERQNTSKITPAASTTGARATQTIRNLEQSEAHGKVVRENLLLRSQLRSLQSEVQSLKTQSIKRQNRIEAHLEEIEGLKQTLELATRTAHENTAERTSVDLLGLDHESDAGEESTLIVDANTKDQSQPSWLELYFPSASEATADEEAQTQLETGPEASKEPEIDDAVDCVCEIQKKALKAGKAVTVEIRNVEEMPDWLAQVNSKIVTDGTGAIRAAPVTFTDTAHVVARDVSAATDTRTQRNTDSSGSI